MQQIKEIHIIPGTIGYIVHIGCRQCGFTTLRDLRDAMNEYFDDPEATERQYRPSPLNAEGNMDRSAKRVMTEREPEEMERPKRRLE